MTNKTLNLFLTFMFLKLKTYKYILILLFLILDSSPFIILYVSCPIQVISSSTHNGRKEKKKNCIFLHYMILSASLLTQIIKVIWRLNHIHTWIINCIYKKNICVTRTKPILFDLPLSSWKRRIFWIIFLRI